MIRLVIISLLFIYNESIFCLFKRVCRCEIFIFIFEMYFFLGGGGRQIDAQDTEITNLESQLGLTKADCRDLQNQMSLINSLFTQMLLGATSADMDLDRLTQLLQVLFIFNR